MSYSPTRRLVSRLVVAAMVVMLLAFAGALVGCSKPEQSDADSSKNEAPAEQPAPEQPVDEPTYSSWVVNINDHDTHIKGDITYTVTLNLTATNPSSDKAGTYTGKAVAKTESSGQVQGQQLNASAIANSSRLEFTLDSGGGTDDDPLAPLTEEGRVYSGTGTIAMNAAGSGTIGQAGGSFSKSSAENLNVKAEGEKVTLTVVLNGQKYTFNGTITGK